MAGRQRDLAVLGDVWPLGQPVERLIDDLHRLVDLGEAHREAVVVVADSAHRDLELEVLVGAVRVGLAQIPRVARRAQQRAGDTERQQRLARPAGRCRAGAAARSRSCSGSRRTGRRASGMIFRNSRSFSLEAGGDVLDHAAHLEVARVHALPRRTSRTGRGSARARAGSTGRSRSRRGPARSVPSQIRCEAMRLSSRWITRRYWRALGTSTSSQRLHRADSRPSR